MYNEEFEGNNGYERSGEDVYSKPVRAGKRTYFFEFKATKGNDYYLTITGMKGNMLAAKATDKKGEEAATEAWAKVAIRNPNDPMLLERIERLNNNAKGFLEVGKPLQAMKCYETVVLIRPNDPVAIHNFGACLMKIGKRDMAEKVLAKAKKLAEKTLDSHN